jgi:hypothetical protein
VGSLRATNGSCTLARPNGNAQGQDQPVLLARRFLPGRMRECPANWLFPRPHGGPGLGLRMGPNMHPCRATSTSALASTCVVNDAATTHITMYRSQRTSSARSRQRRLTPPCSSTPPPQCTLMPLSASPARCWQGLPHRLTSTRLCLLVRGLASAEMGKLLGRNSYGRPLPHEVKEQEPRGTAVENARTIAP